MSRRRESLKPVKGANRSLRCRLTLKGELALALMPTLVILAVLAPPFPLVLDKSVFSS